MNSKPIYFNFLGLVFIAVAVSFPIQILYMFDYSWGDISLTFSHLTYMNYMVILACLVTAVHSFKASGWLRKSILITGAFIIVNNYLVSLNQNFFSSTETLIASATFFLTYILTFAPRIHQVLTQPHMQWWRIPKRYDMKVPIILNTKNQQQEDIFIYAKTFDISEGGVFIPYNEFEKVDNLIDLKRMLDKGEKINLDFFFQDDRTPITIAGEIVRRSGRRVGKYPAGLGLKFDHVPQAFNDRLPQLIMQ